jgi:hypothetical protein
MTRWHVTVSTAGRTWAVELPPGRATVVGDGAPLDVPGAGLAARHVSLLARDEGVVLEVLRGGQALVNDVVAPSQVTLGHGDELRVGEARLVFSRQPVAPAARPRLARHDELMARLDDEVRRGGPGRAVGLALVSAPGLNVAARQALLRRVMDEVHRTRLVACFGELAPDLTAVLLPEVPPPALDALFARLPGVVGPRARLSTSRSPVDGLDAETLLGRAWHALLGDAFVPLEPVFVDPVMVRLGALAEGLAEREGAVCAVGPPGSGRETLLRHLARAAGRRVLAVSAFDGEGLARAAARPTEWVLVRDVEHVPPRTLEALQARARGRLLATAAEPPAGRGFEHVLEVPALLARRDDVLALADALVSAARVANARPRLTLGAEARALLAAWRWPGNVRELENVVFRAARVAVRDELGRDALPVALGGDARADDFRAAMQGAERELLLEALARTRWNVTAAAARLGMPRRTVVHRMAKLGLRRPARQRF